jgi:hypothetical protein
MATLKKNAGALVGIAFVVGMVYAGYTGLITKEGVSKMMKDQKDYLTTAGVQGECHASICPMAANARIGFR